jgi:TPP-dependent 2-oxoacid decarboxylase
LITCFNAQPTRVEIKTKKVRGLPFRKHLHTLSKLVDFSSAKRKRIMYRTSEATQQNPMNGRCP